MFNEQITLLLLDYMYKRHMRRHYVFVTILLLACVALALLAYLGIDTVSFIPAVAGIQ